jgi:hypothetical protein
VTLQTGQPYTINTAYDVNRDGNLTDRLQNAGPLRNEDDGPLRLSIAAGSSPLDLLALDRQDGAVGRNTFRASGIANVDTALSRRLKLTENQALFLRLEAFNLFNRTHVGRPVRILESPGFGHAIDTAVPARTLQFALKYTF